MEVRDKLNTAEKYQSLIDMKRAFISEELKDLGELEQEKILGHPVDDDIIFNISYSIFEEQKAIFIALYSKGEAIRNLIPEYRSLIDYMDKGWNKIGGYVQMIWMLSCGIMLNTPLSEFEKMTVLVKAQGLKDFLIDFLIRYKIPAWDISTNDFVDIRPYKGLQDVILLSKQDKEKAVNRLKTYLSKEWYRGHSDCGWHDNHKTASIHFGYWSFESGALVKILGLDDRSLKGLQYYPYDMVHWDENRNDINNAG